MELSRLLTVPSVWGTTVRKECCWKTKKSERVGLLLAYQPKPDISCATKTGHFNLLPTGEPIAFHQRRIPVHIADSEFLRSADRHRHSRTLTRHLQATDRDQHNRLCRQRDHRS